jgi:hypothetical protein
MPDGRMFRSLGSPVARHSRRPKRSNLRFCLLACLIVSVAVYCLSAWLVAFLRSPLRRTPYLADCAPERDGFHVDEGAVCNRDCTGVCFPRVRGICISRERVTMCGEQPPMSDWVAAAGGAMPSEMLFSRERPRTKVPVVKGECPPMQGAEKGSQSKSSARWIRGTQFLTDLKQLPVGKEGVGPNPHHEAEKVIPAILLNQRYGLGNSTLYWFADPSTISAFTLGLLKAFPGLGVEYLKFPEQGDPAICFEDAVVFSGITNARYMPGKEANNWLREKVLDHCGIESRLASRPVQDAVLLRRENSRSIANYLAVEVMLARSLRAPVRTIISGQGNFCQQVKPVAEADFLITPHGSQNTGFVFARPGAVVLEVFPLYYYIDFFRNYIHAASLEHYEMWGTWAGDGKRMPLAMRLYGMILGWEYCYAVTPCMNYSKGQSVYVDLEQLEWLLERLPRSYKNGYNTTLD